MEIHICENCSSIEQVVNNEIQRYEIISEENASLHRALSTAKNDVLKRTVEITKLKEALVTERQRNLQLSIQHETSMPTLKPHVNLNLNSELQENKIATACKRVYIRSVSASVETKDEMIPLSKYNQLICLMRTLKKQYEKDLETYQENYNILLNKMKKQYEGVREHNSIILDMYEVMRDDLFLSLGEFSRSRAAFKDTIDTIENENEKQLVFLKKLITKDVTKSANQQLKDNLAILQRQLTERDELVSVLRKQQDALDELMRKQELDHQMQRQKYTDIIEDLKHKKTSAQNKYAKLENRRQLDLQGLLNDVRLMRKEIRGLKRGKIHRPNIANEIEECEKKLEMFQETVKATYTHKKSVH